MWLLPLAASFVLLVVCCFLGRGRMARSPSERAAPTIVLQEVPTSEDGAVAARADTPVREEPRTPSGNRAGQIAGAGVDPLDITLDLGGRKGQRAKATRDPQLVSRDEEERSRFTDAQPMKFDADNGSQWGSFELVGGHGYEGEIDKRGKMHGAGTIHYPDGSVQVCRFVRDKPVGEGTLWSPDRRHVIKLIAGVEAAEAISVEDGKRITARTTFGSMFARPWE